MKVMKSVLLPQAYILKNEKKKTKSKRDPESKNSNN